MLTNEVKQMSVKYEVLKRLVRATGIKKRWLCATTEELLDLYGQDYADYMKRVNRCIPWPPRKA